MIYYNTILFIAYSDYLVVEFIEEQDENGSTALSIITSQWLINENGLQFCMWPSNIRTDKIRNKAILDHLKINNELCCKCPITIKYRSSKYFKNIILFLFNVSI